MLDDAVTSIPVAGSGPWFRRTIVVRSGPGAFVRTDPLMDKRTSACSVGCAERAIDTDSEANVRAEATAMRALFRGEQVVNT